MRLKKIDKTNWKACINLSVKEEQKSWISPNCLLLLEAQYGQNIYPFGIYEGDEIVGLLLYDRNPKNKHWELMTLMIDKDKQGVGLGKGALTHLITKMHREHRKALFYAYISPDNAIGQATYESVGFSETGKMKEGKMNTAYNYNKSVFISYHSEVFLKKMLKYCYS